MLPGIAAICLYLILMTTANVYAGLTGIYGRGVAKYGILALCSLLAAGIYGLLRLQKWGWALVTAGCLLFATGYFFYFSKTHAGFLPDSGTLRPHLLPLPRPSGNPRAPALNFVQDNVLPDGRPAPAAVTS